MLRRPLGALVRLCVQSLVTFALLTVCLVVILSARSDPNSKNWAYATVGTIVGFWLKGR